jgi:diguanylate cyclase (GGDEF)-like protein
MDLRRLILVAGMALAPLVYAAGTAAATADAAGPPPSAAPSPAATLVAQARAAQKRDEEDARRLAEQALAQLVSAPDPDQEMLARLVLCEFYIERDPQVAATQVAAAEALVPRLNRKGLRAGMLTCRGESREILGDTTAAMTDYDQAVSSATSANDEEMLARALYARGFLHSLQGEYAQGLADLRRSESTYTKIGQPLEAQSALDGIASAYNRMGDVEQARQIYEKSLQVLRNEGLLRDQVIAEHNIGRASERLGEWPAARRSFESALRLSRGLNYARGEAYSLRGIAAADVATGQARASLANLARARELNAATRDARLGAMISLTEGMAMRALGDPTRARALLNEALGVFRDTSQRSELVLAYEQLALVDSEQGDWRRAFQWQEAAKRTSEQLLRNQIDQRFAVLKLEFDTATREKDYQALLRESSANSRALEQSDRARRLQYLVIGLIVLLAAMFATLAWQLNRASQRMRRLALTDELTGAPNRRSVLALLPNALNDASGRNAAALLLDIDHFKRINDTFGHATGDRVLQLVAAQIRASLLPGEFFGRVGGEEFLIVLPVADLRSAHLRAEILRSRISAIDIASVAPELPPLTASIGVAVSRPDDSTRTILQRADAALYRAKASGRNRVLAESTGEFAIQASASR